MYVAKYILTIYYRVLDLLFGKEFEHAIPLG